MVQTFALENILPKGTRDYSRVTYDVLHALPFQMEDVTQVFFDAFRRSRLPACSLLNGVLCPPPSRGLVPSPPPVSLGLRDVVVFLVVIVLQVVFPPPSPSPCSKETVPTEVIILRLRLE